MEREDLKELLTAENILTAWIGRTYLRQWSEWQKTAVLKAMEEYANKRAELPESTATVSDWKELREKFFKECTWTNAAKQALDIPPAITLEPDAIFEWFKQNIITPQVSLSLPKGECFQWVKEKEELEKDFDFLEEMHKLSSDMLNRGDITKKELLHEMITDWKNELEKKLASTLPIKEIEGKL